MHPRPAQVPGRERAAALPEINDAAVIADVIIIISVVVGPGRPAIGMRNMA